MNPDKKEIAYSLPQRPFGVIDAINRQAAATGSVRYAMGAADADYNGHFVSVYFNGYRGYWLAEYTWAGRNVLCRGSLASCLDAAKREYDRGALGSEVVARYPTKKDFSDDHDPSETAEEFARLCVAAGYGEDLGEKGRPSWWTPLHDRVSDALWMERHGLAPAVGFLANSKTVEEYEAKLEAHRARHPRPLVDWE